MTPYYEHGGITIYHGDCREVLPYVRAGGIITDSPYTAAGGSSNGRSSELDYQFFEHWLRDIGRLIRDSIPAAGCGFFFCDWRTLGVFERALRSEGEWQSSSGQGWRVTQAIVWDRESIGMGSPFRNAFEMIAFWKGPEWRSDLPKDISTVFRCRWPYGSHEFHQAEKPISLCARLAKMIPASDTILDPFMGSGSTLLGAARERRRAIGIEIEERYCEIAAKRLSQEMLFPIEAEPVERLEQAPLFAEVAT